MINITIVEENANDCAEIKDFLTYRGYAVSIVVKGLGCVEKVVDKKPNILILDLNSPGEGVLEFLSEVRKQNSSVRGVVFFDSKEGDQIALKDLGVDACLVKPFNYDDMENIIISLVNEIVSGRVGEDE